LYIKINVTSKKEQMRKNERAEVAGKGMTDQKGDGNIEECQV
jgi:hypothetical protein